MRNFEEQLFQLHKQIIGEVLTLARMGLTDDQFRAFKKMVFELLHKRLWPETSRILRGHNQCPGGAKRDNLDREECAP